MRLIARIGLIVVMSIALAAPGVPSVQAGTVVHGCVRHPARIAAHGGIASLAG